jgi:putative membrane protein
MKGGALLFNERLLESYSLWDMWNPGLLFFIALAGVVYWLMVGPLRYLLAKSEPVGSGQKMLFFTGLLVLYIALGSPLHIMGHDFLFSAHMLEQALVYMAAPPCLLLGIPGWLLRPLSSSRLRKVTAVVSHPIVTVLSFNGLFSFYHLPVIFDTVNESGLLHTLTHTILTMAAIQIWWVIFSPLPDQKQLSELKKIGYVILNGVLLYPVCALIIFAGTPLYSTYSDVPQLISFLPPLDDQQLGGIIMKLVQEGIFIVTLAVIFFAWYRRENKSDFAG